MTEQDVKTVLTQDDSSGMVHARTRIGGQELVDERCNLDDAGGFHEISSIKGVPLEHLCKHCLPRIQTVAAEAAEDDEVPG